MHRICSWLVFGYLALPSVLAAEPADWIWSARYVITENAQRRVIENGAVAIRGDRIVGVGTKAEIDSRFQAKQRLDRPDALDNQRQTLRRGPASGGPVPRRRVTGHGPE